MLIANTTDRFLQIPNFRAFEPGEIRTVSEEDAKVLLLNPFLAEAHKNPRAENGGVAPSAEKAARRGKEATR